MLRAIRVCSKGLPATGKVLTNASTRVRGFSYLHLGGEHPLMYKTLGELLDDSAQKYEDRVSFVSAYQNKRVTFREAQQQAEKLALGLLELGIEKGDRVALFSVNSIEWYIMSLGLAKAGIISVFLNPAYQSLEVMHCLNVVGVKMLITAESFKDESYLPIFDEIIPELPKSKPGELKSSKVPTLKWVVSISEQEYPGMIPFKCVGEKCSEGSLKKLEKIKKNSNADEPIYLKFTSGTTGTPKGVVLSHFSLINNAFFVSRRQNFHMKKHIMCLLGPLFHAMGTSLGILACLHAGITLVIPERTYSPSNAVKTIISENCTILLGTPTMYVDIINEMRDKNLKSVTPEVAISGGAVASNTLFNEMIKNMGVKRVASVYGLTETGPVTFMSKADDDREKMLNSVGHILDYTEAKVVDEEERIVPWNTPGELWVRGYQVMKGYWNDEKKTKENITPDNWFRTGDQFILSPDGYAKVVGRIKDIIIRGGENIFPEDVENFLISHPDILEVQVVGIPDERLGEQVCACIRLKPNATLTKAEVKAFCKGKIATALIPHYVYFIDKFPKTYTGKIQKFALRKEAAEYFKITK